MDIPVTLFTWGLAILPIIVLLILLIKFHWGATEAAPVGLVITAITGVLFYKADLKLLAIESAKGIFNALVILVIVWTAILMYQVCDEANAFSAIRNGMKKLIPNELILVLAMGWIFESFLQGITGFGVPVAVGAPLLIGIGVQPLWAVVIPLLGQAWGNTFGTLGAAWDSLAMSASLTAGTHEYLVTAMWTSVFIWFWNFVGGIAMCYFYGKGKALKKGFIAVCILSLIQGGGELLFSQMNTTLCCFIPACISLVAVLLLSKTSLYRDEWCIDDSPIMSRVKDESVNESVTENSMTLIQAFVPYIALSILTLLVLIIKPVNEFLGQFSISLTFVETMTGYSFVNKQATLSFVPFTHASMFLFLSSIFGMFYYKSHGWVGDGGIKRMFVKSVAMTIPSGISVIGLVIMSRIMDGTGQTQVMAVGIANVLGKVYAMFAPLVGLLGTFMTGSNMSSNILFGGFQSTTAELLGINKDIILGAQSAGGAFGSACSPSKIILGTTTANILGREGEVLSIVMVLTSLSAALVGVFVFGTVIFG